jgi:hypothetical protein
MKNNFCKYLNTNELLQKNICVTKINLFLLLISLAKIFRFFLN